MGSVSQEGQLATLCQYGFLLCVYIISYKFIDTLSRAGAHIWAKDWQLQSLSTLLSRRGFSPLGPASVV